MNDAIMTRPIPILSDDEKAHRRAFRAYVVADAEPWHQMHLGALYRDWDRFNRDHFAGALVEPYILLAEPTTPRAYGDCGPVSGFGGKSQIRLRPSLLTGTHPHMAPDGKADGRVRFVTDVLLHEMIHQWQHEISGDRDDAYHGHGPAFRDKANAIGATLGLDPVRTCKARGPDKHLASCSQWPHDVRPAGYYLGAYRRPVRRAHPDRREAGDAGDAETLVVPADPTALVAALARLYGDAELVALGDALSATVHAKGLTPAVTASRDIRIPFTELATVNRKGAV